MRRYRRLLAVLLFLGALLSIFELSGLRQHFNLVFLQQRIQENAFSGLLVFVLLFALGNLAHVPGWIFLAAAVLAMGQSVGGVATYIAASVACMTTFMTIRWIGGDALRQMESPLAMRIFRQLDTRPIFSIALLRMLFQTVPALNYALAMSGVRLRDYVIGTLLGLPVPIALYCLFFEHLAKVLRIA